MAAYNSYVVEYKHGSTWYAISNVQGLSCSVGRQLPTDTWPVSRTEIRVWYPEGYDSPIANLQIGTRIRFFCPGRSSTKPTWTGRVSDLSIEVGIPWNNAAADGNADFLTIKAEGELGRLGRVALARIVNTATNIEEAFRDVIGTMQLESGDNPQLLFVTDYSTATMLPLEIGAGFATRYQPNELVQQLAVGQLGRVCDGVRKTAATGNGTTDDPMVFFSTGKLADADIATVKFSDTTNNATNRQYDDIVFDSLQDGFANAAQLTYYSTGLGTQTYYSTAVDFQQPSVTFTSEGILNNVNARTDVTNYYANAWDEYAIRPTSVSATTNGQQTQNLDTLGFTDLELGYLPSKAVNIVLRGDNYLCRIEGVQLTADLNQSRFTYYISPTDTTGWFILDSADLGVLNQNKLGLY